MAMVLDFVFGLATLFSVFITLAGLVVLGINWAKVCRLLGGTSGAILVYMALIVFPFGVQVLIHELRFIFSFFCN